MKKLLYPLLLAGLAGCRHDADPTASDSLVGSWRLTNLQCYCPAGWLPDETLIFDASQHFQLFVGGKLTAEGRYTAGTGSACSKAATTEPLLTLTPATAGTAVPSGNYTLNGGTTLVIDQCLAADGPRYTFKRQ